jgi:hypothetical protein
MHIAGGEGDAVSDDTWFNRPMTADDIPDETEDLEAPSRYEVHKLGSCLFDPTPFDELIDAETWALVHSADESVWGVWDNEEEEYISIAYQQTLFSN